MRLGYYKVKWTIDKSVNDNNWSIKKETYEISRIKLSGQTLRIYNNRIQYLKYCAVYMANILV